jgi:hypothetical protein
MTSTLRLFTAILVGFWIVTPALAAPPQISRVTVPALQIGASTTLIVEGTELTPNPRIVLPVPIVAQTVKEPSMPNRVQIDVKLADKIPGGVYMLRLGNDKGISNPVSVEIDDLPQPFVPKIEKLPAYLQGTLSGSATLSATFEGKKGQRLIFEVEARRIGSAIEPLIKLFDPKRIQLAWAQGSTPLAGDTRLTTTLPADGTYTLEMHDAQYRAGSPNRFRLRIGEFQYGDLPFPLAGQRGTKASFQLIGNLPETTRIEADLTSAPGNTFFHLPRAPGQSGPPPSILVSDIPELLESEMPPGKMQELTPPAAINGRISKSGEEDSYRIKVQPGTKLKFDVLAERAGSMLDGVLVLRDEKGTQLVRSDDQPNTLDPGMEYTVPANVTTLVAVVSDVQGRGGREYVYRLSVTPSAQPDFSLALLEDRQQVPRNGAAVIRVKATRTGYNGPIKVTLPGLPDGITVANDMIPEAVNETLLFLTVKPGAKVTQGVVPQVIGESTNPKVPLRRAALPPETPLTKALPAFRREYGVAIIESDVIGVNWETAFDRLPIGGNIAAKVKVTRTPEAKGTIRLTLLTNQVVPKTKAGNMDDVNRAIRLEGTPTIPGILTVGEIKILVPADLPPMGYDVAIRAEMLAADGRTVTASAVTPVRRLPAAK